MVVIVEGFPGVEVSGEEALAKDGDGLFYGAERAGCVDGGAVGGVWGVGKLLVFHGGGGKMREMV